MVQMAALWGMVAMVVAASSASAPNPVVYWASSPTLANETLLVAGAGFAADLNHSAGTIVRLCSGPDCTDPRNGPAVASDVWTQSVQVVLPVDLRPPASLWIDSGGGGGVDVTINAPDVQWVTSGNPAAMPNTSLQLDPAHPSWINTTVTVGHPLRVFGRSLGWDPSNTQCLPGATPPIAVPTTRLTVADVTVAAHAANCYEAAFATATLPAGEHLAAVSTPWGRSALFGLTVLPAVAPPPAVHLDVDADFGGDIPRALAHAAALPPSVLKSIGLGPTSYTLTRGVTVPPNTTLYGTGATATVVTFTVSAGGSGGDTCGALFPADFYFKTCNLASQHCFHDVGEIDHTSSSTDACCARCKSDPACNAFTVEHDPTRGYLCLLKACGTGTAWRQDCVSTNRTQTQSAYVTKPPPVTTTGITVSSDCTLADFGITVSPETTMPQYVTVHMPPGTQRVRAIALRISMLQANVSNAFKIEGSQFEVAGCEAHQTGPCLWPGYGPDSDRTPFQPSTLMYMHGAADGWVHNNTFFWRCSLMDLDVSDRVIFENNTIAMTEPGIPPHGNSISGYDARMHPSNRWWSFARNSMSRPVSSYTDKQDWTQRETVTTDATGYLASGRAVAINEDGSVVVDTNMTAAIGPSPTAVIPGGLALYTLRVLGGSGVGQVRAVTGWSPESSTLHLESPLDDHFVAGPHGSSIGVLGSFGLKTIVGNTFNWTEVVQWYSNTIGGVMADNTMLDCNVLSGGNVGNASMGARGECYNGPGTVWYTEFLGNTQIRSDGIALGDAFYSPGHVNQNKCPVYYGPYIRWSAIRRNTVEGISRAQAPSQHCGSISNSDMRSTDLMSEHNIVHCPAGGTIVNAAGPRSWSNISCSHCLTRP